MHINCPVYVISPDRADELGHQLAMRLRAAYAHLRRRSNLAFAPLGMTADQYVLLAVLARQGQATQQELVRRCASDTATVGTMLSLLEAKGLVTRSPHPRDGRAWCVQLTPPGQALAGKMARGSAGVRAKMVALFSEPELQTLLEYLERLAGAMHPPARKTGRQPPRPSRCPSGRSSGGQKEQPRRREKTPQ